MKNRLVWFLGIRPALKKWLKTPEGREAEKQMKDVLAGKKEIIARVIALLALVATQFGWADFIGPLQKLGDAVAEGNLIAIVSTLFGIGAMVIGIFRKMGENRKHEELKKTALVVDAAEVSAIKQS
jgi:hypothetical protein